MSTYRQALPQLNGDLFITDGGIETTLIFHDGLDLPSWQKRGVGLVWETHEKAAENPKTGKAVTATRRRIRREMALPMRDDYSRFVEALSTRRRSRPSATGSRRRLVQTRWPVRLVGRHVQDLVVFIDRIDDPGQLLARHGGHEADIVAHQIIDDPAAQPVCH